MLKKIREATQDDRGFTLIELMVVVLIIAILIAIAIPTFLGLRERAQDRQAHSNLRNGLTAAKAFYTDSQSYSGFGTGCAAGVDSCTTADGIEPSLDWVGSGIAANQNPIRTQVSLAATNTVVLESFSPSGKTRFCIADNSGATVRGGTTSLATNLNTFAACQGAPIKW